MVRKILLTLIAVLGLCAYGFAQNRQVTGKVADAQGKPVAGATIMIDGTSTGTTTAADGRFSISAPANGTLIVSFIGYQSQSVAISGRTTVNVTLVEDTHAIDDVVVTGYGVQRKASFTGAASIVGDDVLAKRTDANFVKSLEGSVPGLQMNNSTSSPGVWGSVYVRGRGSLNSGTQPLYVIDGMPVNSDIEDNFDSGGNIWFDPMASVNPADIESVTVLKDAAATAIYGSRAANGVIVITTKKGTQGNFNLNVDIKQGFVSMANNNMELANAKETANLFADGFGSFYSLFYGQDASAATGGRFDNWNDYIASRYSWDGKSSYDWIDAITRHGYYQDYNLSASGRVGQTGYYASMGYLNTEGLVIGTDMERFSGRLNLDSKFKFLTVGANTSYSYSIQNGNSESLSGSMNSPATLAISGRTPLDPIYDENGDYLEGSYPHPLAVVDSKVGSLYRTRNQTVNINPYVQVDFGKGIYAKSTLGVNISDQNIYTYYSALYDPNGTDSNGMGLDFTSKTSVITWNNVLGWNYTFNEKHAVNLMLGQEMQRKFYNYSLLEGVDFPFAGDGMRDLSTAGSWNDSAYYKSEATLASYFLDAHYAYDDKYYVSGSFRRDGSSVFGSDNRWGNFWSVGAKWRITGEEFLKDNEIVTNAAIRLSYGTVGNQDIDWYQARSFYVAGYNYNSSPGMIPSGVSNQKLTWEVAKKFDVGFDLSFINRIHMTFDFYNEETSDALYSVPLSMTSGTTTMMQNVGTIRNRGIEFAVNATVMQKRDFRWNAYANITYNQNRVIKLATDDPIESDVTIIEEGRPFRQFYMKEWAGVEYETGKPLWYLNDSGDETTSDYNAAAKRYVGAADPKVLGGFGTSVNWKGLDFNIDFTYRLGGKVYNYSAAFTGYGMSLMTPLRDVALNSWTEDNKGAKHPQYILNDPYNSTGDSSRFLYSADYLKIGNITLGYTLPAKWTKKAFIQKLRVYVSLDNVYTVMADDFVGYTPETFTSGLMAWQSPANRTFTGGIQLTF